MQARGTVLLPRKATRRVVKSVPSTTQPGRPPVEELLRELAFVLHATRAVRRSLRPTGPARAT